MSGSVSVQPGKQGISVVRSESNEDRQARHLRDHQASVSGTNQIAESVEKEKSLQQSRESDDDDSDECDRGNAPGFDSARGFVAARKPNQPRQSTYPYRSGEQMQHFRGDRPVGIDRSRMADRATHDETRRSQDERWFLAPSKRDCPEREQSEDCSKQLDPPYHRS